MTDKVIFIAGRSDNDKKQICGCEVDDSMSE
jgi:hypothetical protein